MIRAEPLGNKKKPHSFGIVGMALRFFPLIIVNVSHVLNTYDNSKRLSLFSDFGSYQISLFNNKSIIFED